MKKFKSIILHSVLTIIALLQLFPLIWLFNYSLQKSSNLFGKKLFDIPEIPQWINYQRAWVDGNILKYLFNSIFVCSVSIVLIIIISFTISYACKRMKWKLSNLVYSFVLLGMVIPIHTTLLPNFMWFKEFGLINSHFALIIPYTAFFLAFSVLMFSGFIQSIPFAMEESAYLEGAGLPTILIKIVAPMSKAGFVTVGIMAFLNCWNEFIMANTFLTSEVKRTLPFSIIKFEGEYGADYAVQFACMMIIAIIPITIYIIFSKQIIAGVTAGAVKG
ncbi:MAG: carbohydrate ABC transporter permease [Spirochaetaceae bacterium]